MAGAVKPNIDVAVDLRTAEAKAGGLIRDCNGQWLGGFHRNIGLCSAFQAELWALLDGLKLAWTDGFKARGLFGTGKTFYPFSGSLLHTENTMNSFSRPLLHTDDCLESFSQARRAVVFSVLTGVVSLVRLLTPPELSINNGNCLNGSEVEDDIGYEKVGRSPPVFMPDDSAFNHEIWPYRPPTAGAVKPNIDGAVDLRTAEAKAGGLIRDCNGQWLGGFHRNMGLCSAFQAELWVLLDGLKLAWTDGFKDIEVELDNQEVVDTLIANPHVHETSLIRRIRKLLQNQWKVKLSYVRREANAAADAIAHLERNVGLGFTTLHKMPIAVRRILNMDYGQSRLCKVLPTPF
ncbi:LRR receptor-like serine/threonine-protein kinase EFR-like [Hibiscus syriacus]|uniref:LRR receptor-like serine/threonine-protein kinase EFR-like n=1 Tax=Hibiscus syriacus TaxID=106335 RepID=A0A6A3BC74_HIBSY|nr:LRR receptor-like serine/threonine-protein kinase EFR-like [Hibiscus syriacus]